MKKIRSIRQLQAEKTRIRQEQAELEDKLRDNWAALKECLRPVNIAKDTIGSMLKNKTEKTPDDGHILKSSFTYGVSLLAGKFADKAGEKLVSLLKK